MKYNAVPFFELNKFNLKICLLSSSSLKYTISKQIRLTNLSANAGDTREQV